jgi:transposase-like protein
MSGKKNRKKYTEEFKMQVADEYRRGELDMPGLQRKYGISSFASVHAWVHKYGKEGSGAAERGFYKKSDKPRKVGMSEYSRKLYEKFMRGIETETMPEFDNEQERTAFILFENMYLKKKLLLQGESPAFIANLWSSKNMGDLLERLGLADVLE